MHLGHFWTGTRTYPPSHAIKSVLSNLLYPQHTPAGRPFANLIGQVEQRASSRLPPHPAWPFANLVERVLPKKIVEDVLFSLGVGLYVLLRLVQVVEEV
jgi:hypothetical protein